jgi:hypothetical protein
MQDRRASSRLDTRLHFRQVRDSLIDARDAVVFHCADVVACDVVACDDGACVDSSFGAANVLHSHCSKDTMLVL